MFDLEESIADWRKQMLAAGIKSPVPREELEIHLGEEIERQMQRGAKVQYALEAAIRPMGGAENLTLEFNKVAASKVVHSWRLFEGFFLTGTLLIPLIIAGQAFVSKCNVFSEMSSDQQISVFAAAMVFSLCASAAWWAHQKYPALRCRKIRDAILVPAVLWVLISAWVVIPLFNFTEVGRFAGYQLEQTTDLLSGV